MRKNQARHKLLEGGVICGPSLSYPAVEMVEEALEHDFDYLWIEWQHGGWTETTLSPALAVTLAQAGRELLLAQLPLDLDTRLAGDEGTPIAVGDSPMAEAYARLAEGLVRGGMA